jgi:argininosuccinate lyase
MEKSKPWGGRFQTRTDEIVETFTSSITVDREIALEDVEGSVAHATMLGETGIIPESDRDRLIEGLNIVKQELEGGTFPWDATLEDVHMNIERRLAVLIGEETAGKLHTARSRNDQVALDERLYLRRMLQAITRALADLELALVGQAKNHVDTLLPGYTHLQRAQPIRLAHHLLAYREMFARDRARIADMLRRVRISPLGAGALAGTPHPIDRARTAALLGFDDITRNSLDAVADRDLLLEAMSASAISMIHLSRLSEEIVLWATAEFSFIEIEDAFTTGSSMMPQKKNPDVAELVRGKCGRVIGDLVALLVTMKALPLSYNRDMQEDKPALFDSLGTWSKSLAVMTRMIPAIKFKRARMREALQQGFVTATELADHLAQRGVPFREAHAIVGRIVASSIAAGKTLGDLTLAELRGFDARFGDDALHWIDVERSIERRDIPGAPAQGRVLAEIVRAEDELRTMMAGIDA